MMPTTLTRTAAVLTSCVVMVLLVACGEQKEPATNEPSVTSEDVKKEAKSAVETTTDYLETQKREYQEQVEAQLKAYDQKLDQLQAKAGLLKEEARASLDEQLESLREKQRAAQEEWEKLAASSGKAWEDMKSGMDRAMDDLAAAYHDAASHFQ